MATIFVIGAGSKLFKAMIPTLTFNNTVISRPYAESTRTILEAFTDNDSAIVLNFAAPTGDAFHFTRSYNGVLDIEKSLKLIERHFRQITLFQIASYAEFDHQVSLSQCQRLISVPKRKKVSLDLLIELPYAYWKIQQHQIAQAIQKKPSVRLVELTVPFIDFNDLEVNKAYYMPGGTAIFPLHEPFDVIHTETLAKRFNYLVENGPRGDSQEIFCSETKSTIAQLCALSDAKPSQIRCSTVNRIITILLWVYGFIDRSPRQMRINDRMLRLGGLSSNAKVERI